jgi:hypothetical protein
MAVVSPCVSLDWIAATVALTFSAAIFVLKRELYIGPILRLLNAVIFGIYLGGFIYVGYLLPYVNEEYVAIFVAIVTAAVVLILLYYLDNSALLLGLLVLMSSYGLIWWLTSILAIVVAAAVAFIVWRNEIDYLSMCFFDSGVMSMNILLSLVGMFTNFWPKNAPDLCSTQHVNIVLVCENDCGSVLTDGNVKLTAWEWGLTVLALTTLRFGWVYWREVCGKEKKVKENYTASFGPQRQCCVCCKPEDRRDCCYCFWRCWFTKTAHQPLAQTEDTTAKLKPRARPPSAAQQQQEGKRRQSQELVGDDEELDDLELAEVERALAESSADQPMEAPRRG